jgi:hypothetical protein
MTGWMWYLIAIGIVALGVVLVYGTRRSAEHRRDKAGYRRTEQAASKLDRDRPPSS